MSLEYRRQPKDSRTLAILGLTIYSNMGPTQEKNLWALKLDVVIIMSKEYRTQPKDSLTLAILGLNINSIPGPN